MKNKVGLIDDISERLSKEFQLALPLRPEMKPRGKKLSEQEIKSQTETGLKRFYLCAEEEKSRHRLGVIARARVAFGLQRRLLEAGYPGPLVKQVLVAMLASVFVRGS
jgi:hypothetical protein